MSQYNPKKIEEMQMVLLKNPRSPVFARLAEAYRKMSLLEEALEVTTRGVKHNPEYVSGLVAHAKILYELKDYRQAIKFLQKAHALKPENLLALKLLGHGYVKLRQHKEALRTFKKLLIVKPDDEMALKFIKKWEFLENLPPDSGEESLSVEGYEHWVLKLPSENHVVHLIDSFMNYGDEENALEIAITALGKWPTSEDIKKRQKILLNNTDRSVQDSSETPFEESPALQYLKVRKQFYENWLQRIEQSKTVDP